VEKAAMIGFVKLRILEPDDQSVLRGARLKEAMMEDIENGLYPFFVSTTLGTTGCCAFDRLDEIGPVCKVGMSGDLYLRCTVVVITLFWGMLRVLLRILSFHCGEY
jgi:glutamate/tyrosine decarboxylase-like PLP-dependent enzyme